MDNLKAILFDSGGVLNYPKMGQWFMNPRFFDFVNKNIYKKIKSEKSNKAFSNACKYINSILVIKNKDEAGSNVSVYCFLRSEVTPIRLL